MSKKFTYLLLFTHNCAPYVGVAITGQQGLGGWSQDCRFEDEALTRGILSELSIGTQELTNAR